MTLRAVPDLLVAVAMAVALAGCGSRSEDSAEHRAACQGPPLRSTAARSKAMEDGYSVNPRFDCIDKASYAAASAAKAARSAAETPEAIARRQAAFAAQQAADDAARGERERQAEAPPPMAEPSEFHRVDVNSAAEAELAEAFGVGPDTAAQIVAERNDRAFSDWGDLVARVTGLSAAQSAYSASVGGLTVNGHSLPGAEFDPLLAAKLKAGRQ